MLGERVAIYAIRCFYQRFHFSPEAKIIFALNDCIFVPKLESLHA